jgi:hypothetical protein
VNVRVSRKEPSSNGVSAGCQLSPDRWRGVDAAERGGAGHQADFKREDDSDKYRGSCAADVVGRPDGFLGGGWGQVEEMTYQLTRSKDDRIP